VFRFFEGSGWRGGNVVFAMKNSFEILSHQDLNMCRAPYYVLCKKLMPIFFVSSQYELVLLFVKLDARNIKSWM